MLPMKPNPSSVHAAGTGKTGAFRSTSVLRGMSHRSSSWLILNRPTGGRIWPKRTENGALNLYWPHICSIEISPPLPPSSSSANAAPLVERSAERSTSILAKRSNSISVYAFNRSFGEMSVASTKRRKSNPAGFGSSSELVS